MPLGWRLQGSGDWNLRRIENHIDIDMSQISGFVQFIHSNEAGRCLKGWFPQSSHISLGETSINGEIGALEDSVLSE